MAALDGGGGGGLALGDGGAASARWVTMVSMARINTPMAAILAHVMVRDIAYSMDLVGVLPGPCHAPGEVDHWYTRT